MLLLLFEHFLLDLHEIGKASFLYLVYLLSVQQLIDHTDKGLSNIRYGFTNLNNVRIKVDGCFCLDRMFEIPVGKKVRI